MQPGMSSRSEHSCCTVPKHQTKDSFSGLNACWHVNRLANFYALPNALMPLQCWDGQLPDLAAAAQYRAIFITGSHYSAYEDLPWINNLVAWLHTFVTGTACATKIVAVCFGSHGEILCVCLEHLQSVFGSPCRDMIVLG